MNILTKQNRVVGGVIMNKFIWFVCFFLALASIVLIGKFSPFISDYDGLSYFDTARKMNGWLFEKTDYKIWYQFRESSVSFWPISNAMSVFIAALIIDVVNPNFIPLIINSIYLIFFVYYVGKLRTPTYVYAAVILLCSHTLIFRLYTTLTTEFSVGLWIFAFLLTLLSNHERRGVYLFGLTVLGLLLRTIDVVFILMATTAYVVLHYATWRDRGHVVSTVRYVAISLLLTAPLFFQHYVTAFNYVYQASFGFTAASWKSLGGVEDRSDVLINYIESIFIYNKLILPLLVSILIFGFHVRLPLRGGLLLVIGIVFAVCFPLFMASSLNIQVVYWVYSALVLVICELGLMVYRSKAAYFGKGLFLQLFDRNVQVPILFAFFLFSVVLSWRMEVPYLKSQKEISNLSFDISSEIAKMKGVPVVASNFRGVGALDIRGLEWGGAREIRYGGVVDIYSKNKKPSDYLNLTDETNFFIAAHDNYFFPVHFGINDHVKNIRELFYKDSSEMGFKLVRSVERTGRYFDVWYRPGAHAHLQYLSFGDSWVVEKLNVEIGEDELCSGQPVSGRLVFQLDFPNPGVSSYAPPFKVRLGSRGGGYVEYIGNVNAYGLSEVGFDLVDVPCGMYELSVDKFFSTKFDSRRLGMMFGRVDSQLKFVQHKL